MFAWLSVIGYVLALVFYIVGGHVAHYVTPTLIASGLLLALCVALGAIGSPIVIRRGRDG